MDKEFKFRFWDKDKEKFKNELYIENNEVYDIYHDHGGMFSSGLIKEELHNIIILQYVGLKDVDDKEIYEGDMLEFTPSIVNNKSCIWKNLGHVWIPDFYSGVYISYNHPYSENSDSWNSLLDDLGKKYLAETPLVEFTERGGIKFKIVGNIFENKDLFDDKLLVASEKVLNKNQELYKKLS